MKKRLATILCSLFLAGFGSHALAVDGLSFELGRGDATDMGRIGLQWDWKTRWFTDGDWHVSGYWDASLGYWHGHSSAGDNNDILDIGFTPVFRLQQNRMSGLAPYAEAGIGFHFLSDTSINADRKFGSSFQFGDHIGVGLRFGKKYEYDLGYRFQHLSNGGIKHPNQGINFNQIRFSYHF